MPSTELDETSQRYGRNTINDSSRHDWHHAQPFSIIAAFHCSAVASTSSCVRHTCDGPAPLSGSANRNRPSRKFAQSNLHPPTQVVVVAKPETLQCHAFKLRVARGNRESTTVIGAGLNGESRRAGFIGDRGLFRSRPLVTQGNSDARQGGPSWVNDIDDDRARSNRRHNGLNRCHERQNQDDVHRISSQCNIAPRIARRADASDVKERGSGLCFPACPFLLTRYRYATAKATLQKKKEHTNTISRNAWARPLERANTPVGSG